MAVDHEIQTKYLEIVSLPLRGQFDKGASDGVQSNSLHFGQDHLFEVILALLTILPFTILAPFSVFALIVLLLVIGIQIFLELPIGHLIGLLILPIGRGMFLHCIVSQMDFPIEVVDIELIGRCPNVAFLEPVSFEDPMDLANHQIMSDVELPPFVEERSVDV